MLLLILSYHYDRVVIVLDYFLPSHLHWPPHLLDKPLLYGIYLLLFIFYASPEVLNLLLQLGYLALELNNSWVGRVEIRNDDFVFIEYLYYAALSFLLHPHV